MSSLHCGVIGTILLFPWGILAVTIVGYIITTKVTWIRAASSPAPSHARSNRSVLPQISGEKSSTPSVWDSA